MFQELCWIHNTHNSDITSHLSNTSGTYEIFKFFLIKAFFLIFSIPGNLCLWHLKTIRYETNIMKWLSGLYIYIYILCLFASLFVILYWNGPKFFWDLPWPQGRFMNNENFKKICKILKIRGQILWYTQTFLFLFYTIQRKNVHNQIRRLAHKISPINPRSTLKPEIF